MYLKKAFLAIGLICVLLVVSILVYFYISATQGRLNKVNKWFILLSYDPDKNAVSKSDIERYDMAILDPDSHPSIEAVRKKTVLIAYVSIGEAETYRKYWANAEGQDWVLGKNPNWPGNYYVDVRSSEWKHIITDEVIPDLIGKGFEGIMMDTIDTAVMLETGDPEKYAGSNEAMAGLIKSIHDTYPELLLISNNGFAILEEIAPYLDGMLTEDIYMMPDFANNSYKKVPAEESAYKISILTKLMKEHKMPVFIVDYIPQKDKALISEDISKIKRLRFKPYIAEKDLDKLYRN